jgi:cytochrome P450
MMRDWRTFSSTRPAFEEIGQPMILLSDDPPDHQRVRTVIAKGMSPAVLRRMRDACVGARVARLESVSLLSALARHVRSIELAGEPEVTTNTALHGHERLPLRIVPA